MLALLPSRSITWGTLILCFHLILSNYFYIIKCNSILKLEIKCTSSPSAEKMKQKQNMDHFRSIRLMLQKNGPQQTLGSMRGQDPTDVVHGLGTGQVETVWEVL